MGNLFVDVKQFVVSFVKKTRIEECVYRLGIESFEVSFLGTELKQGKKVAGALQVFAVTKNALLSALAFVLQGSIDVGLDCLIEIEGGSGGI